MGLCRNASGNCVTSQPNTSVWLGSYTCPVRRTGCRTCCQGGLWTQVPCQSSEGWQGTWTWERSRSQMPFSSFHIRGESSGLICPPVMFPGHLCTSVCIVCLVVSQIGPLNFNPLWPGVTFWRRRPKYLGQVMAWRQGATWHWVSCLTSKPVSPVSSIWLNVAKLV